MTSNAATGKGAADNDGIVVGEHVIEQRGLFYEEFEVGTRYLHRPGRTVTEADNVLFTSITMNTQALHLDAAWLRLVDFWSIETAGLSPSIKSTSGRSTCPRNWRAYADSDST